MINRLHNKLDKSMQDLDRSIKSDKSTTSTILATSIIDKQTTKASMEDIVWNESTYVSFWTG